MRPRLPTVWPIHEVSRWLGHRSVTTTIDIYGHLLPSAWGRLRAVLQRAMRPEGSENRSRRR
jgi:integrase